MQESITGEKRRDPTRAAPFRAERARKNWLAGNQPTDLGFGFGCGFGFRTCVMCGTRQGEVRCSRRNPYLHLHLAKIISLSTWLVEVGIGTMNLDVNQASKPIAWSNIMARYMIYSPLAWQT
jgi:hypothetical protein